MDAMRHMQLIIGEPTGMAIGYAHKGIYDFTIRIHGRSAHSGRPQDGLNSIYGAALLAREIDRLNVQWMERNHSDFDSGDTVNVGTLNAGDVRNRVPDTAVLTGDMRIVPGSSSTQLVEQIERQFEILGEKGYRCELTGDNEFKPFIMPTGSGLVAELSRTIGSELITLGYSTDASVLNALAGLDCAIVGPGDIAVCHRPDEYIEERQLRLGVETYSKVLESWDETAESIAAS
jgi:acetylornithine deacetylase/succinyl-diaminopimelate desuccinylase-like protein